MELDEIIAGIKQKPYYQDNHGVIYNADCLEIMPQIPDKSVDLVLTSPPYNMGNGKSLGYQPNSTVGQKFYGEYHDNMDDEEYSDWCVHAIIDLLRVSRYVFWNVQTRP